MHFGVVRIIAHLSLNWVKMFTANWAEGDPYNFLEELLNMCFFTAWLNSVHERNTKILFV